MISTGVRKAESTRRAKQRAELEHDYTHLDPYDQEDGVEVETFRSCFDNPERSREGLWTINPIAEWPDHWIWDYSQEANLKQCSLYQEGFDRLGCIGCPMAGECSRRREFERWPGFKKPWLRAFQSCIDGRKEARQPILDNGRTAEEWFEWWLSDAAMEEPIDEEQIALWEVGTPQ